MELEKLWIRYKGQVVPQEDVEIIKTWLKQQPHLPDELDDLVIRKFLTRSTSMQHAKKFIDNYFTLRHYAPEIFKNRDPLSPEIRRAHSSVQVIQMPKRTEKGLRVCVMRLIDPDPNHFILENFLKYTFMICDYVIANYPDERASLSILDMGNLSLAFVPRITISVMKKYLNYNQLGQPMKIYQTHIVNCHPVMDTLVSLVKPMLTPLAQKLFFTHRPNTTTLFDYVEKEVLPVELGGTCKQSLDDLHKEQMALLEKERDFFLNEKKWEIDDTKRPGGSKVPKIDEGTFKSLSFD